MPLIQMQAYVHPQFNFFSGKRTVFRLASIGTSRNGNIAARHWRLSMVVTAPSATVHTETPQVGASHPTAWARLAMHGMGKYPSIKCFPIYVLVYAHLFTRSQGLSCEKLEKAFGCEC